MAEAYLLAAGQLTRILVDRSQASTMQHQHSLVCPTVRTNCLVLCMLSLCRGKRTASNEARHIAVFCTEDLSSRAFFFAFNFLVTIVIVHF